MGVTYVKRIHSYTANVKGKQYVYSIKKHGILAKQLAELSFQNNKRYYHIILRKEDYGIMKIYSAKEQIVYEVLIDLEDIDLVQQYKWNIIYAQNSKTNYVANYKIGKLHRVLMNETDKTIVIDHINRNGLDNRKSNLRKVTNSINKKNMDIIKNNSLGINGVHLEGNRYRVVWSDFEGKSHSKSFNINKFSNAFEEAVKYRLSKAKEFGYNII